MLNANIDNLAFTNNLNLFCNGKPKSGRELIDDKLSPLQQVQKFIPNSELQTHLNETYCKSTPSLIIPFSTLLNYHDNDSSFSNCDPAVLHTDRIDQIGDASTSMAFCGYNYGNLQNPIEQDKKQLKQSDAGILTDEINGYSLNCINNCLRCGLKINDRFMLRVDNKSWHENCLRCASCNRNLANFDASSQLTTCFVKGNQTYCKEHHEQLFITKCAQCRQPLHSTDLVLRCFQRTFHCRCFQCVYCRQPLKKGDQYFFINGQIVCHRDYNMAYFCAKIPMTQTDNGLATKNRDRLFSASSDRTPLSIYDFDQLGRRHPLLHHSHHSSSTKIPKRPRTILNAHQRKAFKYAFERGSKPSRKVREQLAKDTGLSVRVVQVWFQNQRAKIKKEQRKQETEKHSTSGGSITISTDSDGKSAADDELHSPLGSIKSETDSELEDFDFDEEILSSSSSVSQPSTSLHNPVILQQIFVNEDNPDKEITASNPIDKLYQMQHTYF